VILFRVATCIDHVRQCCRTCDAVHAIRGFTARNRESRAYALTHTSRATVASILEDAGLGMRAARSWTKSGSRAVARARHGLFRCGALAAALCAAHRSKYSRVVFPPGPNNWFINILPLVRFRQPMAFLVGVARLLHTAP
jgi:hypothetical protein